MSVFTNIGKNISTKSKELSHKAKAMSEKSSLNSIIKGEESKIDFQYKAIGKLYFEKYNEDPDSDFADSINIIKSSIEKIEQTKEEIAKITSQFNCPGCGAPFKNGAVFCSKCGEKLPEKRPDPEQLPKGAQKCENCGNILKKDALFCNVCGNKLVQTSDEAKEIESASALDQSPVEEKSTAEILTDDRKQKEENVSDTPKETETAISTEAENAKTDNDSSQETEEKQKKICPNCNNEMHDEDIFCNECGNKFE